MKQTSIEKELVDIVNNTQTINLIYPNQKDIPSLYLKFPMIIKSISSSMIILYICYFSFIPHSILSGWSGSLLMITPVILPIPIYALLIKKINISINKQLRKMKLPEVTLTKTIHQIEELKTIQHEKIVNSLIEKGFIENHHDYRSLNIYIQNALHLISLKRLLIPIATFRIYMPVLLVWFINAIREPLSIKTDCSINNFFFENILITLIFLILAICSILFLESLYLIKNNYLTNNEDKFNRAIQTLISIRMEMEKETVIRKKRRNYQHKQSE